MSDVMLFGVLKMPYELAMGDEMSRRQFYARVEEAVERLEQAEAKYDWLRWMVANGHDFLKARGDMSAEDIDRKIDEVAAAAIRNGGGE
jgi:hypothetical protein